MLEINSFSLNTQFMNSNSPLSLKTQTLFSKKTNTSLFENSQSTNPFEEE